MWSWFSSAWIVSAVHAGSLSMCILRSLCSQYYHWMLHSLWSRPSWCWRRHHCTHLLETRKCPVLINGLVFARLSFRLFFFFLLSRRSRRPKKVLWHQRPSPLFLVQTMLGKWTVLKRRPCKQATSHLHSCRSPEVEKTFMVLFLSAFWSKTPNKYEKWIVKWKLNCGKSQQWLWSTNCLSSFYMIPLQLCITTIL